MSDKSFYTQSLDERINDEKRRFQRPSSDEVGDAFKYFGLAFTSNLEETKKAYRQKICKFPSELSVANGHKDTLKKYFGSMEYSKLKQDKRTYV